MADAQPDERSIATFAAVKTILEFLIGKEIVSAVDVAGLLQDQAKACSDAKRYQAAGILSHLAKFAADPQRARGRHLLNEPPLGSA